MNWIDLQLFGGRGGSSGGGGDKNDGKEVPYDEWGEEKRGWVYESDDKSIYEEDESRYIYEGRIDETTRAEVLSLIMSYRDDDGTWTDDDMAGYIVYENGKFLDVKDLTGKSFSRKGIIGAYFSDANMQAAWGHEFAGRGRDRVPMTIDDPETGREFTNSKMYSEATGVYRVRVRTTYEKGQRPQRETVRRSTVKQLPSTEKKKKR